MKKRRIRQCKVARTGKQANFGRKKDRFFKLRSEAGQADKEAEKVFRQAVNAKAQLKGVLKKIKDFKPDADKKELEDP